MSWNPIDITDVRLTPTELAVLNNITGATDIGGMVLKTVVGEFIGAIRAGGYQFVTDGTIPDACRQHVINRARWQWLNEFPTLKTMQTPAREKLADKAEEFLTRVSNGKESIEPPGSPAPVPSASGGSRHRLRGRMGGGQ